VTCDVSSCWHCENRGWGVSEYATGWGYGGRTLREILGYYGLVISGYLCMR